MKSNLPHSTDVIVESNAEGKATTMTITRDPGGSTRPREEDDGQQTARRGAESVGSDALAKVRENRRDSCHRELSIRLWVE